MDKYLIYMILGLVFVLAIPIVLNIFIFDKQPNSSEDLSTEETKSDSNQGDGNNSDQKKENNNKIVWGVDSASYTDEKLFSCVKENFGKPEVWGRYLGDKEDISVGLDTDEVNYLHDNEISILVIYNHFTDATGYDHGVEEAEQAVAYAEDLGIPEGVALFGDIEPKYPVDSAFIEGWYDALSDSIYEPALYGVFDKKSALIKAYNTTKQVTQENTVVWTAYPQNEITTKENAPEYNPQGPESSLLYGWQYALEAGKCNIDTNLFKGEMMDYLW